MDCHHELLCGSKKQVRLCVVTWVLLYLMPQLWSSVPVKPAQLSSFDVLELQKTLVMACSCECDVLMLQDSWCLKRNVCWTQLCKQPLLMLHAGFATLTQQLLQRHTAIAAKRADERLRVHLQSLFKSA